MRRTGLLILLLAGCGKLPVTPMGLVVRDGYAFEAKAGGVAAAYAVIVNGQDSAAVLDSITSNAASSTTAHASAESNGLVAMTPLDRPSIAPGDSLVFQPGANHLMLEGLARTLAPGDTFTITYWFHPGGPRPILTTVRAYGS